jgi:predicted small lipoprotein YifL
MSRIAINIGLAALFAFALAACGRKGALEAPPPPVSEDGSKPQKVGSAPNRSFVLDPLVR